MKFMELVNVLFKTIVTDLWSMTPEEVQDCIDREGFGREALYRQLKRKLSRVLTPEGLPALEEAFIEKECHKWIYNRAI